MEFQDLNLNLLLRKINNLCVYTFIFQVPEEAPTFLKGYPLNSSAIHISWESIPSSFYKEKLLGYRVKYRNLGSRMYNELNVTINVTEAVITSLVPHTRYEIEVNAFNKIGHGPTGKVLEIKTLSSGKCQRKYFSANGVTVFVNAIGVLG